MISHLKFLLYKSYTWVSTYLRTRARWSETVSNDFPKVFYGRDHIPGRDEKACGGIIKAQDLQHIFPNQIKESNILYLISSALPIYAPAMVRYAKKYGAKLIVNQNGTAYPAWHGPGWEKANQPMRELLGMADYVFYQSAFCKTAADVHLIPRTNRFEILYNPVDVKKFIPAEIPPSGHRLICAGTHNQFYRVRCAIETIAILKAVVPDIHLTFAGRYHWQKDPSQAKLELEALVDKLYLGGHVTILGPYSQNEIVPLLQRHHIALHTKYNDPCPRLVTEALACGLPVVYSDSGGVPELVGNDGGVGVSAPLDWQKLHTPSPEELAAAVIRVFDQYAKYSDSARKRCVEKFDLGPWICRHEDIFQRIIR